jgi:site-specific DNA-adenine methylase
MTSYHGGKQKIGKDIVKAMCSYLTLKKPNFKVKGYCEPFCGMLGVYRHIYNCSYFKDKSRKRLKYLAADYNKSLILMWKKAQKGWKPPIKCSEERYNKLKKQKKASAEKGFIGHQYSYGGQYFKGYRGKYGNKGVYKKASENVSEIGKLLNKVKFKSGSYTQFDTKDKLKKFVIYCDPPYKDDKSSYYFDEEHNRLSFDHLSFWKWCLKMSKNNIIFVSEYKCPIKDKRIKKIFQKKVNLTGASPTNRKRTEKLYVITS